MRQCISIKLVSTLTPYLNITSAKKFWSAKSKEPNYLGNIYTSNNNVQWLAFVGYQINYKGELRVRKNFINKEIKKQIKETQRILMALGMDRNRSLIDINKYSRKSKRQILFSLQQRLVSMSVGRATLYNNDIEDVNQGLCWTNGFSLLNNNKIVSRQLKELDKRREQQISYPKRFINHLRKKLITLIHCPKIWKICILENHLVIMNI